MDLVIKNVQKTYDDHEVLKGINLYHEGNGFISIVGPSGSGKTTLLNLLGCLDSPQSGEIYIEGIDITKLNQNEIINFRSQFIGFVFQDFNLLKQLTVSENIRLSRYVQGKDDINTAFELINKVGLTGLGDKHPNYLSGGEKQRVAIARALMNSPKLILADEPTGNLDLENSHMIFKMLKEISKDHLVIVITHNITLAEEYSEKIYKINDGILLNEDKIDFKPQMNHFIYKPSSFFFKGLLKLSFRNLLSKKWRAIMTMFSLLLTLLSISILFSLRFGINDAVQSIYKRKFDIELFHVQKDIPLDKKYHHFEGFIYQDDMELINKIENISAILPEYQNLSIAYDGIDFDGTIRIIEYNQYFKDGMTPYLIGEFPNNENEIVASMEIAQKLYPNNYKDILNKEFVISLNGATKQVKIVGINTIDTGTNYYVNNNLVIELKLIAELNHKESIMVKLIGIDNYDIEIETSIYNSIKNVNDVSSLDLLYGRQIENDDEILISLQSFYDGLDNFTDANITLSELNNNQINQNLMNQYLSSDQYIFPDDFFRSSGKERVKVVGIYRSYNKEIITSNKLYDQMTNINPSELNIYIKDLSKYKSTKESLERLGFTVFSNYESELEDINRSIHDFTIIFGILTVLTTSIAFVLLYILISNQVRHRISEFGILKALGTKNRDIVLLLISEGIIIGMIASIIMIILSFIITPELNLLMNRFVYNVNYENVQFLHNNIFSITSVLLTGIVFTALVSIIPGLKAAKLNPVDAINRG